MINKNKIGIALLALLAITVPVAMADLVHSSREDYYQGGTIVTMLNSDPGGGRGGTGRDWFGNQGGRIGNPCGNALWEVDEKVYWETGAVTREDGTVWVGDYTVISYTVLNDDFKNPPFAAGITSFHVPLLQAPFAYNAPGIWEGQLGGGAFNWSTTGDGIPWTQSLDTFQLIYLGWKPIGFIDGAAIDVNHGPLFGGACWGPWVISGVVPAPGAAGLLVVGIGLVGWFKRRIV